MGRSTTAVLELNHLALAPGAAKEEALLFERAQVDVFLVKAAAVGVRRGIASESSQPPTAAMACAALASAGSWPARAHD
jgi:hypothetical protein